MRRKNGNGSARPQVWACFGTIGLAASVAAGGDGPVPFTEEAVARGINYTPNQAQPFGDGLAVADLDGDGDADVIAIGRSTGAIGLYENDGTGHFVDRFGSSGIGLQQKFSGVVAGDYDRDGDLDIFISRHMASDVLLRNDGNFTFTNVTAAAGVGDTQAGAGAAWGDFDGDGWLDLYASTHNSPAPNRLWRNLGDGTFEDVAPALGVTASDQYTFQAVFVDYDRDGDPDLYLTNSYGQHCAKWVNRNLLFRNDGGVFTDVTDEANALACVDAMCIAVGDFDNNGWPDFYVTDNNTPGNALLMNQGPDGDGVVAFEDQADVAGVESFATGWGSAFFDFDNDGWLDLYVCNPAQPNRLYRHDGTFPCVDVASDMGVAETGGSSFSLATADFDLDGDLDLLVCSRNAPLRLFINHEGERRSWARFDVVGEGANRWAINAKVAVRTGEVVRHREVLAGSNYKNQNELVAHLGLADAAVMDEVTVNWRSGTSRTFVGLPANRAWRILPPDKLGDADEDGDRDLADFVAMTACDTGPGGVHEPGCEPFDFDGDADVDLDDLDLFIAAFDGTPADCNGNGVADMIEIFGGSAPDADGDGLIDDCGGSPIGDLDGDQHVGSNDLMILLGAWGESGSPADLDGNGTVGFGDLTMMLSHWG